MRFWFKPVTSFEDVTANFDQVEQRFNGLQVPMLAAPPSDPENVGPNPYLDSTKDAAGLPALGYWGPTNGWRYI